MSTPEIRHEQAGDEEAIFRVHGSAFGRPDEACLVDALRASGNLFLSLVALSNEEIVGHIAFVPLTIENGLESRAAVALAPVGVMPGHQRNGIGAALIHSGLQECDRQGHPLVIVLGDPDYYGRFGFVPTRQYGIHPTFNVPADVFMLRYSGITFPPEIRGTARYPSEFDGLD